MEQTKLKRFKRILLIFLFALVLGTGALVYTTSNFNTVNAKTVIEQVDSCQEVVIDSAAIRDSIEKEIISEVTEYLKKQSPSAHQFIPKYLVRAGLNYNIDICFMMAQTQLETNFGTLGAGRELSRRSMFGVAIRRYSNYEEAINDYCKLLHKSYLGKGRTEKHLMTKYTTHSGARYASNPSYEAELSRTYKDIIRKTRVHSLQMEWNENM